MLQFAEYSSRNKGSIFTIWRFINAFTLSPLNGISSWYFLNQINSYTWLMSSNTFRQIMLNETSSRLQSTSRKIKSNVTVISKTRCAIFQQLKVLIHHKMSYIVSLWWLCKLIFCWIETPITIWSLIKWWIRFDMIDDSWFFQHKISITSVTKPIVFIGVRLRCMKQMKDHQTKSAMLIILALLTMNRDKYCEKRY